MNFDSKLPLVYRTMKDWSQGKIMYIKATF